MEARRAYQEALKIFDFKIRQTSARRSHIRLVAPRVFLRQLAVDPESYLPRVAMTLEGLARLYLT